MRTCWFRRLTSRVALAADARAEPRAELLLVGVGLLPLLRVLNPTPNPTPRPAANTTTIAIKMCTQRLRVGGAGEMETLLTPASASS